MTTTKEAEATLFGTGQVDQLDDHLKPERCRVSATYCPSCGGWVEVRLRPVRLRCTRCGVEARP